jgi:DNA-binding transcriptional LysR family regulator
MRHATLRQLRVFATVARTLSFSAAARELHLTQPAVSLQVKQLEGYAGLPLFEKVGRRVYLTEAGRELARYAGAVTELLREAEETLGALAGVRGGRLTIGVVSTAKYFAPTLLAEFTRLHSQVNIRLLVANREDVVRSLAANEIDLAIMGRPPRELATEAVTFAQHPHAIIAAPSHPLAAKKRMPLARLADENFLIREPGSGTRSSMERVFHERGATFRASMEMSSNETIKQAVMAGMGVSFLSLHTVGLELETGRLVLLDIAGLPVMREWHVIHLRDKRVSPAARLFRDFLLEHGAALIERATGVRPVQAAAPRKSAPRRAAARR